MVKINSITLVLKLKGEVRAMPLTPHVNEFDATKIFTVNSQK